MFYRAAHCSVPRETWIMARAPGSLWMCKNCRLAGGSADHGERVEVSTGWADGMAEDFSLVLNITVALGVAACGGFVAAWLRQSPIVGYLLAGVVIGPFTPG